MKALFLIPFLFLPGSTFTEIENPCNIMFPRGEDEDWGEGAYYMPDDFNIPLYKSLTEKETYGFLRKVASRENMRLVDQNGKDLPDYYSCHFKEWIGHSSLELLMAKKCENPEFVCVLWKYKKGGVFAKKADLKKQGAAYYTYWDYLFKQDMPKKITENKKWASIGVNLTKNCLNLRMENNVKSDKIKCIPGNDGEISETGANHLKILEHHGNWAKVEVITLRWQAGHSGEDNCLYKEFSNGIGWVKAIDEKGFPNIWYSVTSY